VTYRERFTDAEWRTLRFAPLWTFSAVAGADGVIDDLETAAVMKAILDGGLLEGAFVREVFVGIAGDLPNLLPAYKADTRNAYAGLRDAACLLARIEPRQAAMFRLAVMAVGKATAEASGPPVGDRIALEEQRACAMAATMIGFDLKESEAALAAV
jgi:hypothetical protein